MQSFYRLWLIVFLHGLVLVLSALTLFYPFEQSLSGPLLPLAILMLLLAGLEFMGWSRKRKEDKSVMQWLIAALFDAVLGVFLFFWPDISLTGLIWILAFWSALTGSILLYRGLKKPRSYNVLGGGFFFLLMSLGILFFFPSSDNLQVFGLLNSGFGISLILLGLKMRQLLKKTSPLPTTD
ncbi:MAG: hypothetical protein LPK45_06180 [Bacteroidota bacterium]|nr:hypothetical protein [Bacteroidota bacterium]MDX5430657.1 hypothetical protein [Bacteroidota bacterium]MDX5469407.1 hypothetical protein [Bacteroidota bacterium]